MQVTLNWLDGSNLFLVPLDDHQEWYRFHHLFRELLQQRVQGHLSPEELTRLHRRASTWSAEQGLIDQALAHALAAGDESGAAHLVEAHFFSAYEREQWTQMDRLLSLLPEELIKGSPILLRARAWILFAHGEIKDFPRLLTAAERLTVQTFTSNHCVWLEPISVLYRSGTGESGERPRRASMALAR